MCEFGSAPPTLGVLRDSPPLAARVHPRLRRYRDGGEYNSASCHPVSPPERERAGERDLERERGRESSATSARELASSLPRCEWQVPVTSSKVKTPCSCRAFRWMLWETSRSYFESLIHWHPLFCHMYLYSLTQVHLSSCYVQLEKLIFTYSFNHYSEHALKIISCRFSQWSVWYNDCKNEQSD